MLNVLYICLFLMSCDSGYTSLSDNEAIVSYDHIKQSILRDIYDFFE